MRRYRGDAFLVDSLTVWHGRPPPCSPALGASPYSRARCCSLIARWFRAGSAGDPLGRFCSRSGCRAFSEFPGRRGTGRGRGGIPVAIA